MHVLTPVAGSAARVLPPAPLIPVPAAMARKVSVLLVPIVPFSLIVSRVLLDRVHVADTPFAATVPLPDRTRLTVGDVSVCNGSIQYAV